MSQANFIPGSFSDAEPADDAVSQLNSLLRGEMSAIETYRMAIDKVTGEGPTAMNNVTVLQEILEEHTQTASQLRDRIISLGGEVSESSGAWGAFAQTVQGTANLFGDTAALKSLKEGEEHGAKDYEKALNQVDVASQSLISEELIPATQRHIDLLKQLVGTVGSV